MTKPLIEVRNLKMYFPVGTSFLGGRKLLKAVDDVSFDLFPGETFGLVGESGCGKTTVGRSLVRLYRPTGGQILLDGTDIAPLSERDVLPYRRRMQMIFQDPYASLNPYYTVEEIVSEGMRIHKMYKTRQEYRDRVFELLETVGLHREHASRFPHEFSGGQRQRVGIARALALNPEFIVCDEAISALDVSFQAQLVNMLVELQQKLNLTYLFIAHDLSMVRHISDQTAVMYVGNMVEYGDTNEVYSHAAHPYTQGLLSAVPVADPIYERSHQRIPMDGEVPSPVNPGAGCRFCSRCSRATARCREEAPELVRVAENHFVACHNL